MLCRVVFVTELLELLLLPCVCIGPGGVRRVY